MKLLKICSLAILTIMLQASCKSNSDCPTTPVDTTAAAAAAMPPANDGTSTAATPATDTMNAAASAAPETESGNGVNGTHARTATHATHSSSKPTARAKGDGPDMKAEKKREGNFTNGTGADNPGR